MASLPVRDQVSDHLLTPKNAALVVIDYQPSQFAAVNSMDHDLLLEKIVSTVKTVKAFAMPIVHSISWMPPSPAGATMQGRRQIPSPVCGGSSMPKEAGPAVAQAVTQHTG